MLVRIIEDLWVVLLVCFCIEKRMGPLRFLLYLSKLLFCSIGNHERDNGESSIVQRDR